MSSHSLSTQRAHEGSKEVEYGISGDGEEGEWIEKVEGVNTAVVQPRHTTHHHMTGGMTSSSHHYEHILHTPHTAQPRWGGTRCCHGD